MPSSGRQWRLSEKAWEKFARICEFQEVWIRKKILIRERCVFLWFFFFFWRGVLFIFKLFFFFLKWTILKIFIEFVTVLLLFYVSGFWQQGMWDLSFLTRDWTWTPALEGKVLTAGLPGKSLEFFIFKKGIWRSMVCGHSCSSLGIWLHLQPLWWGTAKWHFWVELCVIHM